MVGYGPRVMTDPRSLSIDVVSDVVCPWCLIGSRRLEQALAELPDVKATVVFRPFLLDPTAAPEGGDLRERLRAKYGVDPEVMFGRVEAAAKDSGIPLDFAKVRRWASTVGAHTLLRHAIAKGTQPALARALFDAYFLEGRDIGDASVLASIAEAHGFGADEATALVTDAAELAATKAEAVAASRRGISGVPFVILDGRLAVSGAQPVATFKAAIERALTGE
jgi:predicted DsbA family dithiol-disulfide isomerase